jgi:hypothetical protein
VPSATACFTRNSATSSPSTATSSRSSSTAPARSAWWIVLWRGRENIRWKTFLSPEDRLAQDSQHLRTLARTGFHLAQALSVSGLLTCTVFEVLAGQSSIQSIERCKATQWGTRCRPIAATSNAAWSARVGFLIRWLGRITYLSIHRREQPWFCPIPRRTWQRPRRNIHRQAGWAPD